ncbi:hypothetical protein B0H16DRAFT_1483844 [Mycena metata]|uniref:Uncharacterized protein n=1 Tax=Mycena metata TaxID=1033252 RepID=A0AAD7GQQ6_9AGAR|nr:hypothetical protein B0H16DRAFT_1483844 [Mycena metata]
MALDARKIHKLSRDSALRMVQQWWPGERKRHDIKDRFVGPLYKIIDTCEKALPKYDHDELWLYNFWRTNDNEPREHSTFRYFSDVGLDGETPWNSATIIYTATLWPGGWGYEKTKPVENPKPVDGTSA